MCVTIQGQTATSHQPFHPGLCVSLSRGRLPPVINHSTLAYVCHYPGTIYPVWGWLNNLWNGCRQNRVHHRHNNLSYRYVGYIPVDNSHLHPTPQAPLNHSGVCLCDLIWSSVKWGLHQGVAQLQQEGLSSTLRPKSPLRLSFRCGYLSGKYGIYISNIYSFCYGSFLGYIAWVQPEWIAPKILSVAYQSSSPWEGWKQDNDMWVWQYRYRKSFRFSQKNETFHHSSFHDGKTAPEMTFTIC